LTDYVRSVRPTPTLRQLPAKDLLALVIALIIIVILTEILIPGFASPAHMLLVLYSNSSLGMLAIAETLVILSGDVDFSVGSIYWNVIVIGAVLMKGGQLMLPVVICLALGLVVGLVNGFFTSVLKIPSFITTLGMMIVLTGALYIIGGVGYGEAAPILASFSTGRILGIPNLVLVWVSLLVLSYIFQDMTRFGWTIRALGSNARAVYCSGMNPVGTKILAFVISGLISAIAGLLWLGYQKVPYPIFEAGVGVGAGLSLEAIAAVMIGGTLLVGGRGGVHRTFIGVLIISILTSALISIGLGYEWRQIFYGFVILAVTAIYTRTMQ
jgi:ribose/xylose/arabinose/galactoside ABC-type transport system permease subunit